MTDETTNQEAVVEGTMPPEPVLFWHTEEDAAVLCSTCGVEELNAAFPVQLGLVRPFVSMEDAIARFATIDKPDYFISDPHGKCVECGAEA